MKISLFQLNIYGGYRLDEVITYIKENDFDIVQLQEVGAHALSKNSSDNFKELKERLNYKGEMAASAVLENDPDSYSGVATFYKSTLEYSQKEIIWMKPFAEIQRTDHDDPERIKQLPRNALALKFDFQSQPVWLINTHLAWGPNPFDEPYKIEQAKILTSFLKELNAPLVLSGDFNVTKESEIVRNLDLLGDNHVRLHSLTNTLNPHLHRAKQLFPEGLAVDYIYTSPTLKTSGFSLVDEPNLSDHYGLTISFEV